MCYPFVIRLCCPLVLGLCPYQHFCLGLRGFMWVSLEQIGTPDGMSGVATTAERLVLRVLDAEEAERIGESQRKPSKQVYGFLIFPFCVLQFLLARSLVSSAAPRFSPRPLRQFLGSRLSSASVRSFDSSTL